MTLRTKLGEMAAFSDEQLNPAAKNRVVITGIDIPISDLFVLGIKILIVSIPIGLALGFLGMVVRAM